MLEDVAAFLTCPHCGGDLSAAATALRCARGHNFDVARHGYVSLLGPKPPAEPPDTSAMVAARAAFLRAGHFLPIARALAEVAVRATGTTDGGCVMDIGAGPGYYLAHVLGRMPLHVGLAIDISKPALRRAARAHPRIGAVGCDVRARIPVRSGAASLVLDVFAPRNAPELRRILRPDGALLVVTPTPDHLRELVGALGLLAVDPRKPERIEEALAPHFTAVARETCAFGLSLGRPDAEAAAGMGPSARHLAPADLRARLDGLPAPFAVTASVEITTYRPR